MNNWFIFSILSFTLICFSFKTVYNNEKLYILINKAKQLEKNKDFENALEVYNESLKIASSKNLIYNASYIYKKIGLIYYKQKKYEDSKIHFKKSILRDSVTKNAADSYFNLGLIYRRVKEKDSLFWALNNSLNIYKNLDDSADKFSTYSKAGILFKQAGQFNTAITYLLLAYDGFSKQKNLLKNASVCYSIGETQRLLGNLEIARKYLTESLNIRKQLSDTLKTSYAYNNLANLYKNEKNYKSAIVNYREAIKTQNGLKKKKEIGKMLNNLATVYFLTNKYKLALKTYKKALAEKKLEQDTLSIAYTYNELALLAIKNKTYNKAKSYLDSSKLYLSTISKKEVWLRYYEVQSEYHKSRYGYKVAFEFKEKQYQLYKELFDEKQSKTIQALQEKFENQLKLQKISELQTKNEQKKSVITIQNQTLKNKNLLLFLFGLLILILIGIYFFIKQKQREKLQILENKKLEEILESKELVKSHISKDLHDIITTSYDGIRLKILALEKAKNPKEIRKTIIYDIKNINHEIRLISHRLSPLGNKIKEASLNDIIISQLSEFQHYRQIFVAVQLPLPNVLNQMILEAQTNFYGILLEILNNIEKHSKATKVEIKHHIKNNKTLLFEFCDNGIGFKNEQVKGIGLMNIKQRTKLLGGDFIIIDTENGTSISINFPIKQNLI
ncbi:tetratricopeptide repeat protein [Polaribacter sp. Z022]|uniref:tetratricopeptide repeat-containing sensor histidine kinase n=1 Tax=Polaribacter sp. Z022 TaxID=2927125 RepID=UPI002021C884|nr:tetratricopeptide repeat protein [Polaribacter sp. Z022]MCL7753109.1 tetratricopeptide repeat protein [Polaribacter sp. Z022]